MVIFIFTGIIEEMGKVLKIEKGRESFQISIKASEVVKDLKLGDSIAINGVCLTAIEFDSNYFKADVMPETLHHTSLKNLRNGDQVNLERAIRVGDRLGGHLVQGHVDGIGIIREKQKKDIATIIRIKAPLSVLNYTVSKGSIAIDGISLTIVDVGNDSFSVSLIPHTGLITTLGFKKIGDEVNLESDIIGKYIEKFIKLDNKEASSNISMNFLSKHGFS